MNMANGEEVSKIERYFDATRDEKYVRYKSCEYCYNVFTKNVKKLIKTL